MCDRADATRSNLCQLAHRPKIIKCVAYKAKKIYEKKLKKRHRKKWIFIGRRALLLSLCLFKNGTCRFNKTHSCRLFSSDLKWKGSFFRLFFKSRNRYRDLAEIRSAIQIFTKPIRIVLFCKFFCLQPSIKLISLLFSSPCATEYIVQTMNWKIMHVDNLYDSCTHTGAFHIDSIFIIILLVRKQAYILYFTAVMDTMCTQENSW